MPECAPDYSLTSEQAVAAGDEAGAPPTHMVPWMRCCRKRTDQGQEFAHLTLQRD